MHPAASWCIVLFGAPKIWSVYKWMRCAIEITTLYKLVSALGKFSAFVFVSQPIAINNAQIESWPPPAPQITHNRVRKIWPRPIACSRLLISGRSRRRREREKQLATHSRRSLIMCFYYTNFRMPAGRLPCHWMRGYLIGRSCMACMQLLLLNNAWKIKMHLTLW